MELGASYETYFFIEPILAHLFLLGRVTDKKTESVVQEILTYFGSFMFVPQLIGCILFAPPDAGAIILHNDLICNDTCSVTGVSITYGERAQNPEFFVFRKKTQSFEKFSHL